MTALPRRAGRRTTQVGFWLAAAAALLVAHDAVLVVQTGPGRAAAAALRSGGHAYWPIASWLIVAASAACAAWWGWRLATLSRLGRAARERGGEPADGRRWAARAVRVWPRLFVVVAVAFLVQENVEHAVAHGHVIGLGALLGQEYPLALPVLTAISGLAACLAALVREREAELIGRIGATRPVRNRGNADARPFRSDPSRSRPRGPLAQRGAGRAPPLVSLATANA